jgi:hypothetical protein
MLLLSLAAPAAAPKSAAILLKSAATLLLPASYTPLAPISSRHLRQSTLTIVPEEVVSDSSDYLFFTESEEGFGIASTHR